MAFPGVPFKRLIPAAAVAAVLGASLLAVPPSLASSTNNCGVKGYGYHDHGKVCPNRPFPGHGIGVLRILGELGLAPTTNHDVAKLTKTSTKASASTAASTTSTESNGSKVHGRSSFGHSHGRRGGNLS